MLEESINRYRMPGLFDTDQCLPYKCDPSTRIMKNHGIDINMDGRGAWKDNVFVVCLWQSAKYEEGDLNIDESAFETRQSLKKMLPVLQCKLEASDFNSYT